MRTWARRGQTPVIKEGCRYKHLSAISAISEFGDFCFHIRKESFDGKGIVEFLRKLLAHFKEKLLILWDGAKIHKSEEVKQFLTYENNDRIHLECLPAYSPQLNADEQVWAYIKCKELKNVCCKTLDELYEKLNNAFLSIEQKKDLIMSFFKHPDVAYY
jgi:transposase